MHSTISSHSFLQDGCGSIVLGNSWKWQLLRRSFAEWIIRMDQFGEMSKTKPVVHAETSERGTAGKRMNGTLINIQEKHNGYAPRDRGRDAKYSCNSGWTSRYSHPRAEAGQDTSGHFLKREPIGASTIGNRLSTDEQIQFPIEQRVALRTDTGQEDADLTILKLARRATM